MKFQKINLPKPYYEEHNLLQTPAESKNKKQQEIEDYLKPTSHILKKISKLQKTLFRKTTRILFLVQKKKRKQSDCKR